MNKCVFLQELNTLDVEEVAKDVVSVKTVSITTDTSDVCTVIVETA